MLIRQVRAKTRDFPRANIK